MKSIVGIIFSLWCISNTTSFRLNEENIGTKALVFKADFSQPTLSTVFNSSVNYGNQNVILWASGGGIDVRYPEGSYVPSGHIVEGFGVWTKHRVATQTQTAVFKYGVTSQKTLISSKEVAYSK
jgi:hypothetical protein